MHSTFPVSDLTTEPRAAHRINQMKEPMRSRVIFYAQQILERKKLSTIDQDILDKCVGRAFQDKMDDEAIRFNNKEIFERVRQAEQGIGIVDILELIDGDSSRDLSRSHGGV